LGPVAVKVPRVRDRSGSGIKLHSRLLPPYLRRTRSLEELLPWLYFKGVSTGDFQKALAALLGEQAQKALDTFLDTYRDKYPQAAQCLEKDREQLLTSHDFSAMH
jgi:transposase-like protein